MAALIQATAPEDVERVRALFAEYARAVNAPQCFVGLDRELAALPAGYFVLLLASESAGCVGVRRLDAGTAEMKRLYVRPAYRGHGLGRRLAEAAIAAARRQGCRRIVLDSLPGMREARSLYRLLGFEEIPSYSEAPTPGATCFELRF
jgi:putative acetyltransferase